MVNLSISVEGQTEENFVKVVLAPYFRTLTRPKIVKAILIGGLGGDVSYKRTKIDLEAEARDVSVDYVTTLYDFYGFKDYVSGDTNTSIETKILQNIDPAYQAKIIPYIQVYEFEGILFSDPPALSKCIRLKQTKLSVGTILSWANTVLNSAHGNPEGINNKPNTAPSKRLEEYTNYKKTHHGPLIASHIGLLKMRSACKNFNNWMSILDAL